MFCDKDLIDISLETISYIEKVKKHYSIFKMAITDLKNSFLFTTFLNSYSVVSKMFGLA